MPHVAWILLLLALVSGCHLFEPNDPAWEPVATYPSPIQNTSYGPIERAMAKRLVAKNIRYVAFGKKQRTFCVPAPHAATVRQWLDEWIVEERWNIQVVQEGSIR